MWAQIRGFLRALFRPLPPEGVSYSLAKTLRESTHVRGGGGMGGAGGGIGVAGTEAQHRIVADGHDDYAKSFEQRERPR